jgi:Raf kinase inhibitor-like YbhB/YbcL family protein
MRKFATLTALLALGIGTAAAQDKGGKGGRGRGGPGIPPPVNLKIAGFAEGAMIPTKFTCAAGQNAAVSPAIEWSGAPAGTASFAIIMHDPDVALPNGDDVLHWAIFNIPGTATSLPEHVPNQPELEDGARQPNNIAGSPGYFGPCPPMPTTHHYMFEFYALDEKLDIPAASTRADLLKAMTGHIRAKGVYFGMFHQ